MADAVTATTGAELAGARVLVVNDDGIEAPGIHLLEELLRPLAREVWVVAPELEASATGHAITIRRPLRLREVAPHRFAVDGSPADAAMIALRVLMRNAPPDLVVSGINRGGNIGGDVLYSGTVGAAMEAALCGVPAIAVSQDTRPGADARWETARRHLPSLLPRLARLAGAGGDVINVNLPDVAPDDVAGVSVVPLGRRKPGGLIAEGNDPAGRPYLWISTRREMLGDPSGTDLEAIAERRITVTPLKFDLTDRGRLDALREALA